MRKVKEQLSSCEQGITVCKTSSQIVFPNMPGDTSRVVGHCKRIPRPDRNRITPDKQRYWKRKMGFWASGRQTGSWKARSLAHYEGPQTACRGTEANPLRQTSVRCGWKPRSFRDVHFR